MTQLNLHVHKMVEPTVRSAFCLQQLICSQHACLKEALAKIPQFFIPLNPHSKQGTDP
jgi:hypothetical protein